MTGILSVNIFLPLMVITRIAYGYQNYTFAQLFPRLDGNNTLAFNWNVETKLYKVDLIPDLLTAQQKDVINLGNIQQKNLNSLFAIGFQNIKLKCLTITANQTFKFYYSTTNFISPYPSIDEESKKIAKRYEVIVDREFNLQESYLIFLIRGFYYGDIIKWNVKFEFYIPQNFMKVKFSPHSYTHTTNVTL